MTGEADVSRSSGARQTVAMTLAQLLVLQTHDSTIDRLQYQRANLPEFAALATLADEEAYLLAQRVDVATRRDELARDQKRLEDEAASITSRIDVENERLYSGAVSGHKDLIALQHEVEVLGMRRGEAEDQILELMELAEPLDEQLAGFDRKLADVAQRRAAVTASVDESQSTFDREIAVEQESRVAAAAGIDLALIQLYESDRVARGGVAICRLVDTRSRSPSPVSPKRPSRSS